MMPDEYLLDFRVTRGLLKNGTGTLAGVNCSIFLHVRETVPFFNRLLYVRMRRWHASMPLVDSSLVLSRSPRP
jgi:hypothetical protein